MVGADFMAIAAIVNQAIWLRKLLADLDQSQVMPNNIQYLPRI